MKNPHRSALLNSVEVPESGLGGAISQDIDDIAVAVAALQARWPPSLKLSAPPSLYDSYPSLFLGAFPTIDSARLHSFALAGRLFVTALFVYDDIMDNACDAGANTAKALRTVALQAEAYRLLYRLLPPDSIFWEYFQLYLSQYADALLEERMFSTGEKPWDKFDVDVARRIAVGKSGVARATIAGLAALAGDAGPLPSLVQALDDHSFACQILDDLSDWKDDRRGCLSLLLAEALPGGRSSATSTEKLAVDIYYGGHALRGVGRAIDALVNAERLTASMPDLPWRATVRQLQKHCDDLLRDMTRIVRRNVERAKEKRHAPEPPQRVGRGVWGELAGDALRFTLHQWELGFGEARHVMRFPRHLGFQAEWEHQYGDIFQRAIVADALSDAAGSFPAVLPIISSECDYLLSQKQTHGLRGWSYFPNLPELPADADDLAAVLQVLVRGNRLAEARAHCEPVLETLFRDNGHADGSFETWIVPREDRTRDEERQVEFIRTSWGSGPDATVMANLLYALALYDRERFQAVIDRGIDFIESRQGTIEGSWGGAWYHGRFYGAYVVTRLLAMVRPSSPAMPRVVEFLKMTRRPDGGWGTQRESNALGTAFALLTLSSIAKCLPEAVDPTEVAAAASWLGTARMEDGGWPAVPFIRMSILSDGIERAVQTYQSRTMTTTYVLKAALAWGAHNA